MSARWCQYSVKRKKRLQILAWTSLLVTNPSNQPKGPQSRKCYSCSPTFHSQVWSWTSGNLTCRKYCLMRSACSGVCGLAYTPFSGKPASPGMSNRAMAREYISCWPCDLDEHLWGKKTNEDWRIISTFLVILNWIYPSVIPAVFSGSRWCRAWGRWAPCPPLIGSRRCGRTRWLWSRWAPRRSRRGLRNLYGWKSHESTFCLMKISRASKIRLKYVQYHTKHDLVYTNY